MKTLQQERIESNLRSLDELKAIASNGIKVLIPGHIGLIKVTDDLLPEYGTMGYTLTGEQIISDYPTVQIYARVTI